MIESGMGVRIFDNPLSAFPQTLRLAALFFFLLGILAAEENMSVDVFVNRDPKALQGPNLTIPAGTNDLQFLVKPRSLSVRYKLEGLDEEWNQRADTFFFRVVFFNQDGDPIETHLFPASGRSAGWRKTIEDSDFTNRSEKVPVPRDSVSMSLTMTTAGPSTLVGIYATREITVSTVEKPDTRAMVLMSDGGFPKRSKST
jgi:hypothetical protein